MRDTSAFINSLGQVCAIIGAQWGDEGKGKATDIVAQHFDVIARACGGANAGHTIVVAGHKHVFHLLPSGCLHGDKKVILGSGMVVHLPTLLEEIALLRSLDVDIVPRLTISHEAHIVFGFHRTLDAALEERRSKQKGKGIGTTKRGIGPAYMDKTARCGIRMGELHTDLRNELIQRKTLLEETYGVAMDVEEELSDLADAREQIGGCIGDTVEDIHSALHSGKTILVEGAQGTLLDIDHGTYPYVTSSSTTASGALQGLGLPPRALTSCIGVAKAYCTRVGEGEFPTEAEDSAAKRLRERGGEFGATTGRPRRCGWLSLPDLRRAAYLNGITHWNLTKLDVLDEEDVIPVGITRGEQGMRYQEFPGWKTSTAGITGYDSLPANARAYIEWIEEQTQSPVALIGTGQGREEIIVRS